MVWFCIIWILNALISWWNAYAVGRSWAETKAVGGWPRLMAWMGAVMADCGFSWCLLILLVLGGNHFFPLYVTDRVMSASLSMGFIVLGPAIVISGLAIWLDSWKRAFREGGFMNYGVAIYNTYAQIHNSYAVIEGMGPAFKSIGELFKGSGSSSSSSSDDAKDALIMWAVIIAVGLAVVALIGGTLLTMTIIRSAAGNQPLSDRFREAAARNQGGFGDGRRLARNA